MSLLTEAGVPRPLRATSEEWEEVEDCREWPRLLTIDVVREDVICRRLSEHQQNFFCQVKSQDVAKFKASATSMLSQKLTEVGLYSMGYIFIQKY